MDFFAKDQFSADIGAAKSAALLERLVGIAAKKPARAGLAAAACAQAARGAASFGADFGGGADRVVVAASTGGPRALMEFCSRLPADFPAPVAVVQHNSSGFDKGFVQWLSEYSPVPVRLAQNGALPAKNGVYVAPTDRHLLWTRDGFALDADSPPVNNQKPAADLLFKSAAAEKGGRLVSVVLTGMGADGADGTRAVKLAGGRTIAQDEASALIYGMPRAAFETGCVDMVLPLSEIPATLVALCRCPPGGARRV
jgi:two-component system chemotaxis response regulator CheB